LSKGRFDRLKAGYFAGVTGPQDLCLSPPRRSRREDELEQLGEREAPMRSFKSRPLTARSVAWDAWRAKRGGSAAIAARQQARLQALVEHARRASRFYAEHYRAVPSGPIRLEELDRLPAVAKPELMARFDDWVTDPAVTRAGVEQFVADLDNLGRDFLGRYVVFTTSGSTGVPALLVQDQRAVAVMTGLAYVRGLSALSPKLAAKMLTRPPRVAAVFAHGGHFLSTTMFERRLRTAPFRRRFSRFFSVLDPLPVLVERLNAFQPAMIGTYASALAALTEEQEAGRLHISPLVITSGGELLTSATQHRAHGVSVVRPNRRTNAPTHVAAE
jgi:phenylacetate-CoA ligase